MLIIKKRDNTIMLQSGRINNLHHIIYIYGVVGVSGLWEFREPWELKGFSAFCKRLPFRRQKATFWKIKGNLLDGKRLPFAKRL